MNINLFISDDSNHSTIIKFCKQSKKINFNFIKLNKFRIFKNKKNLIILKENILITDFKKTIKKYLIGVSKNVCLFLPINSKITNAFVNFKTIKYPVNFVDFETQVLDVFKFKKNLFNHLELKFNNILYNNKNKKQIHLTEIESEIINVLFNKEIVDKKAINTEVLHQSKLIDSKSLDSHLYRLRKKLYQIDTKSKIISIKNKNLKII